MRIDVRDHAARCDVDELEAGVGLIQQPVRIGGPRRRTGAIRRHRPRRSERRSIARDRPYCQQSVDDRGHLRPIGRPRGTIVFAHSDRLVRRRFEPPIGRAVERNAEHLVGPFAEPRRVHLQRRNDQRGSFRRPARTSRFVEALVRLSRGAALRLRNVQLTLGVDERDPRAVG